MDNPRVKNLNIMEENKQCTKCDKYKPLIEFGTKNIKTGIYSKLQCKKCEADAIKEKKRSQGVKARNTRKCRKCKENCSTALYNIRVDVCDECVKKITQKSII